MADKFSLHWDVSRPILRETLGPGVWTEDDDESYIAALTDVLRSSPEGGFDFISDANAYTMQSERPNDEEIYDLMARAGCRRLIQVAASSVLNMQTARILRGSAAADLMTHTVCSTMDQAVALLS